jgi:hypothetical protein
MNVSLAVAFQRIFQVKRNDRLLLPLLQPKVPGNPAVMLIDFAVALSPAINLLAVGSAMNLLMPSMTNIRQFTSVPCFHLLSHQRKVSLIRSTPTEMRGMDFTLWMTTWIAINSLKTNQL